MNLAIAAVLSSCLAPTPIQPTVDSSLRPPNVVIMFTDDQGYGDLGCYGHPTLRTPNLDRLAVEGARLTQFYVPSPVCSPSRAALLTGCYPKRVGMHKHVVFPTYDYGLHPDEDTIADALSRAGYATGCFGKWHLGHRDGLLPTDQGFDVFVGIPYSNDMSQFHRPDGNTYTHSLPFLHDKEIVEWEPDQRLLTRRCTQAAVDFIDANADADRPFFAYVPHAMPHIPLYASEDFEGTSRRGLYGDVIEEIDWSMGEIVAALERHDILDDTIVVFATDNGPWLPFKQDGGSAGPLAGGKGGNKEGGQRVPCLVRHPARIPAGLVVREVATSMDLLPTIGAWTGVELDPERTIDGHDITALLGGEKDATSPTEVFLYYTAQGKLAGIRQGRWKLMLESGSLHDLEVDVAEKWNLAKKHPAVVERLRGEAAELDASITAEARPVLKVPEPLWDPAIVVRPEPESKSEP